MNTGKLLSIIAFVLGLLMMPLGILTKVTETLPNGASASLFIGGLLVALFAVPAFLHYNKKHNTDTTQRLISDKELLRLFQAQPGGLLSVHMIAEKTGLSVAQARSRAMSLTQAGVLRMGHNKNMARYFFELTAPLEAYGGPELSPEPFLTVGDLQHIFRAYDHKVSPQDLIMATGLPWNVLLRELEHFRKKGVVDGVRIARPDDSPVQYLLLEPYLSAPPAGEQAREMDLEIQKILLDERLIV